jgi:GTP cyclohydrolase FolE2
MKDVQSQPDYRQIPIDKVGIKNLRYPITVRDRRDGFQHTIAAINMFVDLPHDNKGTHMSRFVELLHLLRPDVSLEKFSVILENMKKHLNAASAHLEMTFPYFIEKAAPVSTSTIPAVSGVQAIPTVGLISFLRLLSPYLRFVPAPWRSVIMVPITSAVKLNCLPVLKNSSGWKI